MRLLIGLARNSEAVNPNSIPKVQRFLQLWHWRGLKGEGAIEATMAQRLVVSMFQELPPDSPARKIDVPSVYVTLPINAQQWQALEFGFDPHLKFPDRWITALSHDPTTVPAAFKALHEEAHSGTASRVVVFRVASNRLKNTLSLSYLAEAYGTPNLVTASDFRKRGDIIIDTTELGLRQQLVSDNIVASITKPQSNL